MDHFIYFCILLLVGLVVTLGLLGRTITTSATPRDTHPLKYELFFETHCPDSGRFIYGDLIRNIHPNFKSTVEVNLVPCGKCSFMSTTHPEDLGGFRCQHGPNECKGNAIAACIIDAVVGESKDQYPALPLLSCYEQQIFFYGRYNDDPMVPLEKCLEDERKDMAAYQPAIKECYEGKRAVELMTMHTDATLAVKDKSRMNYVPWHGIAEDYSNQVQSDVRRDTVGALCARIEGSNRPKICHSEDL